MKSPAPPLFLALFLCACAAGKPPPHTVEVYRPDGTRQCYGGGISAETMRRQLDGITVYAARSDSLPILAPTVCGGRTGGINVYRIAQRDLAEARRRGFALLDGQQTPSPKPR